jgi:putative ABC transport system permease protein
LFFYIRHEQSYDSFHKNKDHLYRLESAQYYESQDNKPESQSVFSFLTKDDDVDNHLIFSLQTVPDMQQAFPEIENITGFRTEEAKLVKAADNVFKEPNIIYTDTNFFKTFSFRLLAGNIHNLLSLKNSAVLSESTARKYFGTDAVVGKIITLKGENDETFTITGIAADPPEYSSVKYSIILPNLALSQYNQYITDRLNYDTHLIAIQLRKDVSLPVFEKKLAKWSSEYFTKPFITKYGTDLKQYYKEADFTKMHWTLRKFNDSHYNIAGPWGHYTNAKNIYQLACFVIIILLIASLNYVLLSVSNITSRSREVGVRKVMGAKRKSVILQFWVETQILVFISVLAGFMLAKLFFPLFNQLMVTDIALSSFSSLEIVTVLTILAFILGVLAGYYPALLVSKLKTTAIIKSIQTFKINPRFSKILVITQFTGCIILMIAAFVMNLQMRHISNKNLGFDKEQVLMIKNPTWDISFTKKMKERLSNFSKTQPYVTMYSGMNGGLDGAYNSSGFTLNGEQKNRVDLTVDFNFFEMLGLKIIKGRSFSRDMASDTSKVQKAAVVNETLFNMLGKTAKIGEFNEPINARIIGVVKDYNFESLSKKIEPEKHILASDFISLFLFKIKPGKMQEAITKIEKEWKEASENYPFEYTFLDESINKVYEPEMRWQSIIQASCFFAIFIACLGLFGLSAINAVNRTKEIGIRKVLGASVKDIFTSLSTSFVFMIAVAIVIATPIAWWVMNRWLEDFAYRIQLNWWMFAVTGIIALLIALGAVSYHAIKAAMANPVKSLRTE